ncbi:hypothetical protein ACQJBY_052073 [Aegilops geniculata]|uniref:Uncharacterized protein n=1 Tax=Aegilops tauschii TaxID=37682 RepID=M8CSU1_AEGTA
MSRPAAPAALVLIILIIASGGVGLAARPLAGGGRAARELTGATDSSAQPSNCTYGHNTGGQCPPSPAAHS